MSERPGTNVARFVRSARALLAFQLIASAAAAALAFWAVVEVRALVEERDALVAQVARLEAARPIESGAAPAPMPEEPPAVAPRLIPPVATVDEPDPNPVRARPDPVRPEERLDERPQDEARPADENLPVAADRPREPQDEATPKSEKLPR